MTEFITLGLVGLIFIFMILLLYEVSKQSTPKLYKSQQLKQRRQHYSPNIQSISSTAKRTLHQSHPLRIKLLAMVGGDVRTADRLLQQCQQNNPGMNTEWYFDKVIYDLTRDRH